MGVEGCVVDLLDFWGQIAISLRSEAQHPQGKPQAWRIWALTSKMPDPESVLFLVLASGTLPSPDAALSPRRATHFSLLRQRKVSKRKGDPGVCVPPLRFGQPPVLSSAGVPLELASLRQSRALSVWASAPQRIHKGFGEGVGIGFGSCRICATLLLS